MRLIRSSFLNKKAAKVSSKWDITVHSKWIFGKTVDFTNHFSLGQTIILFEVAFY